MTRLTGDKPENYGVLLHHSDNKTNVLPTFQVHNLLTGTLLLSTFFSLKNVAKIKKNAKNAFLFKNKLKNVFHILMLFLPAFYQRDNPKLMKDVQWQFPSQ